MKDRAVRTGFCGGFTVVRHQYISFVGLALPWDPRFVLVTHLRKPNAEQTYPLLAYPCHFP